jgi:hypothetical protein
MPSAGFELAIPEIELPQNYALYCNVSGINKVISPHQMIRLI